MPNIFFTLVLGFILGIKHAFEPDHVIAVSTIVSEQKNPFKAALIGTFWGLGHTFTLFIIGIIVLFLKLSIPENLTFSLEGLVGIMLVILGIRVMVKGKQFHAHKHEHDQVIHKHLHYKEQVVDHKHHVSFLVGIIHGIAGSGVSMLLVLSTVPSVTLGLYYILVFGLGSVLGMSMMSFIIGIPFSYSFAGFPQLEKNLRFAAAVLSILFGLFIVFTSGLVLF